MPHYCLVFFAVWLCSACLHAAYLHAAEVPPNILWITCEDMSPRIGCYGDKTVATPNIDRLARESVRYTRAFGTYGVCAPNRHTLITGMYPASTGAMAMRTWKRTSAMVKTTDPELYSIPIYEATPPAGVRCFPEYLRAAGYYCTNNVKTDYQFREIPTAWDESSPKAHWRNRPTRETPFFAVFNSTVTHESKIFRQTSPKVVDPADVPLPPYYPDTPMVRRDLARQYDNIARLDAWVGDLLSQLESDDLNDNTIVFFFSDHGDGLPRMKRWVYDSGIHVPLLIRFPDSNDVGKVNEDLVSFVDFAPTVLSLAGLEIPSYMQGQTFLGQQAGPPRKYIFAARDRMDSAPETIRAVRDQRFKYIRNYRPELPYLGDIPYRDRQEIMQEIHRLNEAGELSAEQWQFWAKKKPLEELYDTETDPHEIHNLATEPRYFDKLAELRDAHDSWTHETGDLGHIPERELILHLWPPDGKQPIAATPKVEIKETSVTINCETVGASIGYRLGAQRRWHLYVGPFQSEPGVRLTVQAFRIGWKPSEVVQAQIAN